jgi:hypothetical protein
MVAEGLHFLSESINKLLSSIDEPSLGKILDEELLIAKKLKTHISKS